MQTLSYFSEVDDAQKSVMVAFRFLPYLVLAKSSFSFGDKEDRYSLRRRINLIRQKFCNELIL